MNQFTQDVLAQFDREERVKEETAAAERARLKAIVKELVEEVLAEREEVKK